LTSKIRQFQFFCKEQRLLILLLFALFDSIGSYAQKFPIKTYKKIENIDLNGVSSVLQDSRQLLWLGTANGLYWYDGSSLFKPQSRNLPEELNVTSIIQGKDSSIYISSFFDGLFKFSNDKFMKIKSSITKNKIAVNEIIFLNKSTTIADDENALFEIKNDSLIPLIISNFDIKDKIIQIEALNDTCFAILLSNKNELGIVSKKLNQYSIKFYNKLTSFDKITYCTGIFWCSNSNKLFKYNTLNDLLIGNNSGIYSTKKEILNFFTTDQSKVWIKHNDGLSLISNDSLILVKSSSGLSNKIENLCLDTDGNTWFACGLDGLIKLMPQQYEFIDFTKNGYDEVLISGFNENDKKNIFCAFTSILIEENNKISQVNEIDGKSIEFPSVIGKVKNGNLVLNDIYGLIVYNRDKFKRINNIDVEASIINDNDEILFASSGYLIKYFNNKLDTLKLKYKIQDFVSTMLLDSRGNLWMGLKTGGIHIIDKKFNSIGGNSAKTGGYRMRSIFEDGSGNVYIGTRNAGLYYYKNTDLQNNLFKPIKLSGIEGVWIKKIGQLNDSILLVCHEKGIDLIKNTAGKTVIEHIKFYLEETLIEPFGMSNLGSYFMIAARKGYFKIAPNNFFKKTKAPSVFFKRIIINGEVDTTYPPYGQQLYIPTFKYTQNNFKFDFVAISYKDRINIKYKYRLLGSDTNWIDVNSINELYFANISPGIYKLEVIALDGFKVKSYLPAVYKFEILAPYYQTLWFKLLLLLLLLTIIYSSIGYIFKRNLKEKILILEKEQALEKERIRISQDMHDDLGSGLTKIAILSEVTKNEMKDPERAKKHLENISQSSRQLVESLQNIIWIMNTNNEGVEDFFAYIHEYALKFLENSNIQFKYHIDSSLLQRINLSQEVRRNIFLVIKEALNNTVKHADCNEIIFQAKKNKDKILLMIEDNGKGFDENQIRKKANGLKSMKERILSINGKIEFVNNDHDGFKIYIEIPILFSH